ncbi:MAG: hypothetical protein KIA06_01955 [Finegoldia magna]|uniref:hypothetical protein n=1 Tax=Finegoldia magna TaxID=1260 RepID=UPI0026ECEB99|nr:hypothetical protein [Finegoldia magna]MBS5966226.1 hypothetical protein [Finegoldia magna]
MKKIILVSLVISTIILFCMNTIYPDIVFADSNTEDIELKIINRNSQEINKSESIEIGNLILQDKLLQTDYETDLRNFVFYFNDKTSVSQLDKAELEKERDILLNDTSDKKLMDLNLDIARIIAKSKNGHSNSVKDFGTSYLPIMIEKIGDKFYIIDASKNYEHLLYKEIIKINDYDINDVYSRILQYCPGENEYIKQFNAKYYYAYYSDVYIKEKIIDGFEFELPYIDNSKIQTEKVKLQKLDEVKILKSDNGVLDDFSIEYKSKQNPRDEFINFFKEKSSKSKNFYCYKVDSNLVIKYNKCFDNEEFKISEMNEKIGNLLTNNRINNIVIDIRDNSGGYANHVFEFLTQLVKIQDEFPEINFKILIGNGTYSSCTFLLGSTKQFLNNVQFIGEYTGAVPFFTSTLGGQIYLGKSKLLIQLSEGFIFADKYAVNPCKIIDLNCREDTWYPDMFIENQIQDYAIGNDRVMNYALQKH